MAEITTEFEPEQFDLFEDRMAQAGRLLRASVDRLGLTRVSGIVGKDPSTISHQLSGLDPGKVPSAKLHFACWFLDPRYRADMAGLCGEVLARSPDLDPEDVVREVIVLAGAGEFGNTGRERVLGLVARMRKA